MARLGLIIPSSNTTMEVEFYRNLPRDVTIHSERILLRSVSVEELKSMRADLERAVKLLATAEPEVVVFGCTTGSLVGGAGYDVELERDIEKISGRPGVATARAVVQALQALGARRISVATPYIGEVNMLEKRFLESQGYEVVNIEGLGLVRNTEIGALKPPEVYRLGLRAFRKNSDALFLSCTNMRTFEVIPRLERRLGVPVMSSNSATMWRALKILGTAPKKPKKLGTLFTK